MHFISVLLRRRVGLIRCNDTLQSSKLKLDKGRRFFPYVSSNLFATHLLRYIYILTKDVANHPIPVSHIIRFTVARGVSSETAFKLPGYLKAYVGVRHFNWKKVGSNSSH